MKVIGQIQAVNGIIKEWRFPEIHRSPANNSTRGILFGLVWSALPPNGRKATLRNTLKLSSAVKTVKLHSKTVFAFGGTSLATFYPVPRLFNAWDLGLIFDKGTLFRFTTTTFMATVFLTILLLCNLTT